MRSCFLQLIEKVVKKRTVDVKHSLYTMYLFTQDLRLGFTVMQSIEDCDVSLSHYAVAMAEPVEIVVSCEQGMVFCIYYVVYRNQVQI